MRWLISSGWSGCGARAGNWRGQIECRRGCCWTVPAPRARHHQGLLRAYRVDGAVGAPDHGRLAAARVQVVKVALLLAEPAPQEGLWQDAAQFAAAGVEQLYVAGPVNQEHVRLPPERWQTQVATA